MITKNVLPYALMFLSGFAGLGYEMVWIRALSAGLGHEILSVLAVMAAFFVGTATRAWILDHRVRLSPTPERWYAALEIIIAVWAVALSFLIPQIAPLGAMLMGVEPSGPLQCTITFLLPLVLLLPATMAMGATLPAMDCITAERPRGGWLVWGQHP